MKSMKLKRLVSVLLSIVMMFGLVYISAPSAYAEDNITWPQIEKLDIDQSTIEWVNVADTFSSEFKGYYIDNYNELKPHPSSTESKKRYYVGTIYLYFDKLPTEEERLEITAGINFTPNGTEEKGYINWHGTTPATSNYNRFDNKVANVYWAFGDNDYSTVNDTSVTTRALEDVNKTRYIYDIKLVKYTEPGSTFELSDSIDAERSSLQSATCCFSSNYEGVLYYAVYDSHQENPIIDTSVNGADLVAGTNNFVVNNLSGYGEKYVYIIGYNGSDYSNVLEFVVPGYALDLNHEVQALDGFCVFGPNGVIGGDFYTERFEDAAGNIITKAVPGETVKVIFGANGGRIQDPITRTEGNKIIGMTKSYQLNEWVITGVELDSVPTSSDTLFSFIMPENEVTVRANMSLVGSQIKFSSNITVPDGLIMRWDFYRIEESKEFWDSELNDVIPQGGKSFESLFKKGLNFRANSSFKPGFEVEGYKLDRIEIWNNGVNLEPSEEVLYETGFMLEDGDNYEFKFIFREKAFAFITTASNDSLMGTASASVNSTTLVYEGETVILTATPNEGYVLKEWQVKDDNGTTIPVTIDSEDPNKASFVMTADYSDEITATAVFEAEGQEEPTVAFRGHRLLLSGQIGVSFGVDLSELSDEQKAASYMEFTVNGKTTRVDTSDAVQESGLHIFTCFINSIQMAEPVTATFHYGDDTVQNVYSVKEYISYIKEHESSYKPVEVALTKGIADYGHYAQPFLARTNNWTIGTDYEEMDLFFAQSYDYDAVKSAVEGKQLALTKGSSKVDTALMRLSLDSETAVTVRLTVKDNTALTASAVFHGKTYSAKKQSDGAYIITIPGITAAWLGDDITINGNADGEFTVTVSALSFVSSVLNSDTYADDAVAKNAVSALYYYYTTTMDYRAANGQ